MKKALLTVLIIFSALQLYSQSVGGILSDTATVTIVAPEKASLTDKDAFLTIVEGQLISELAVGEKTEVQLPAGETLFYFVGSEKVDEGYRFTQSTEPFLCTLEKGKSYTFRIQSAMSVSGIKLDFTAN